MSTRQRTIDPAIAAVAEAIETSLAQNAHLQAELPDGGRVVLDRQLPFFCVLRAPTGEAGMLARRLIASEPAHIIASDSEGSFPGLEFLCRRLVRWLSEQFDGVLLLELWPAPSGAEALPAENQPPRPGFRIVAPDESLPTTVDALAAALGEISVDDQRADVEIAMPAVPRPPGLRRLLQPDADLCPGCFQLGLEVKPIYWDPVGERPFPQTFSALRSQLTVALRRGFAAFAGSATSFPPVHFEALGASTVEAEAGEVDRRLSKVAQEYDFLLLLTPTNVEQAWQAFSASRFAQAPPLFYRPLPFDVDVQKRRLFNIHLENIAGPTLDYLLRGKRDEMDLELTMLQKRGQPEFRYAAMQLFGEVSPELLAAAEQVLRAIEAREARTASAPAADDPLISSEQFRQAALAEIDYYRAQNPAFDAGVELRDDVGEGLMVSRNQLLIPRSIRIPQSRVRPLLQHEVGTHLLTYFNGRQQPFRQMASGLAGYEALQEGLAVLAEYLVEGLSLERMRVLALRVIAANAMLDRADFVEVFRLLHNRYGLDAERAFYMTVRTFRGGGFPKDMVYLQGLMELLAELDNMAEFSLMLVGKMALAHLPYIRELRRREVVHPPALLPRFFSDDAYRDKLKNCRTLAVHQLV